MQRNKFEVVDEKEGTIQYVAPSAKFTFKTTLSSTVIIETPDGKSIEVKGIDLIDFIGEVTRQIKLKEILEASPEKILGL